jgi:protoporphyrinogen oxidase
MEDAYVAQFGRTLYELFFRTYSEKLWGEHPTLLSGDWVAQRSRGLSLIRVVREAVGHSDETVESLVERFMYPRLGYGRISERMAEEIAAAGGAVDLGCRVTAVHHESGTISGVTVSDGARERFIGGDAFISSIPMTELIRILQPSADSASVAASRALTYRDLITIHVMLDRPRVTGETWMYVQDPGIIFARLHEPRNWSPALAPEGKTSLVLEIFSDAGDGTWQCSDQELCEVAIQQLAQELHFIQPSNVIDAFAVRSQDAYPRYGLGYRDAVSTIKDHLHSYRNLSIVGRGGTFRYNNTDHAIETGLLAARNLLGQSVDPEAVNRGPEYIEERRVPAQRPGGAQASI